MKRVLYDVLLLISVFILPWWISIPLSLIGLFLFRDFYEFIIINIVIYGLYSTASDRILSSPVWMSVIVSFTYIIVEAVKKNIILYNNDQI